MAGQRRWQFVSPSIVARERSEEQAEVAQYNRSQAQGGFGTLGDLLGKRKVRKK